MDRKQIVEKLHREIEREEMTLQRMKQIGMDVLNITKLAAANMERLELLQATVEMLEEKETVHRIKILPEYLEAVYMGIKKFECRKNDRDYKVGDLVELEEWTGGIYTGRKAIVQISYVLTDTKYGLRPGYCVFGWR